MNRERKYRVWDISHKTFLPTDVYALITSDFGAFGIMLKDWDNYKEGEYLYPNSQIQSDFTGKLDDNRKEIYEGDIVVDIIGKHYSVEWNDDTCKYQLSDGSDLNDNDRYGTYLVVIGNVYENPNLIN